MCEGSVEAPAEDDGTPERPPRSGLERTNKMSSNDTIRDVRHVKAARELLRWDQERLAREAGLSVVSVRRYEAARAPIAADIERSVVAALETAGVVFVHAGEVDDAEVSGGVLLRTTARPESPAAKRVYVYGAGRPAGRPAGKKDASVRKHRSPKGEAEG